MDKIKETIEDLIAGTDTTYYREVLIQMIHEHANDQYEEGRSHGYQRGHEDGCDCCS